MIKNATDNRQDIMGQQCGCFFCLRVYNGNSVTRFIDNGETAICPWCGIDSVLPAVTDLERLEQLNDYYFGSEYDE